jgi:hypothetical protein
MTSPKNSWVDEFLFYDLVAVSLLLLVDWFLGETRRQNMRERAGEWWLHVQEYSYQGLAKEDAAYVRAKLVKIFGENWLSPRFVFGSFFVSSILSGIVLSLILLETGYQDMNWQQYLAFIASFTLPNAILDWMSLSLTIYLLGLMARSAHFFNIVLIAIVDVIVAIALGVGVVFMFFFLVSVFECENLDCIAKSAVDTLSYTEEIFIAVLEPHYLRTVSFSQGSILLGAIFTSTLPSLIHLFIALIFLGSKLIRPIGKPVVSAVLFAFHDSKKGVLSVIAVGLGAAAKLIQQWSKTG